MATDTPAESTHEKIRRIGIELAQLCSEKNKAYGSSFEKTADFLKLLWPDGIQPAQYNDLGLVFRIYDKLMRVAHKKEAFGESPYRDIAGYGMLGAAQDDPATEKPFGSVQPSEPWPRR